MTDKKDKSLEELSGEERLELIAQGQSKFAQDLKHEVQKAIAGPEVADMIKEALAQQQEAAREILEKGHANDASEADAGNERAWDWKSEFMGLIGEAHEAKAAQSEEKNLAKTLARGMYFLNKSHNNPHAALEMAEKSGHETSESMEFMARALGVGDFSSGGALFQPELMDELVEELLPNSVLVNDPALPRVSFNGSVEVPYISSGPTTRYTAESGAANASDIGTDRLMMMEKLATVIVPVSEQFMRSVPNAERFIVKAIEKSATSDVDGKLLRSTGASNEPVGLRYLANASNLLNVNATVNAGNVEEDIARCIQAVLDSDVDVGAEEGRWAFAPRTWRYLWTLRNTGESVFKSELATGRLNGYQVRPVTTAIPTNLAVTDTSESEIYFYNVAGLMMGIAQNFRVSMGQHAYNDSSGTVVSAFSRSEMVWKVDFAFDMVARYRGHEIAALIDVDWS